MTCPETSEDAQIGTSKRPILANECLMYCSPVKLAVLTVFSGLKLNIKPLMPLFQYGSG